MAISKSRLVGLMFAGVVMLVGTRPVGAAPIAFSDQATFLAAAGPGLSFESFEAAFATAPSVAFADFTVAESGGIDALGQLRDFPALGVSAVIVDGTGGLAYDDNGTSIATFFGFAIPVNAFGIWLATSEASTVTIGGFSVVLAAGVPAFFGVIDPLATFSSITFDASGGPNVGFDAAYYGTAAAVPEPATLLLLGTGLGAVAARRRLKKRT